jgi:hypothetical protein
MFGTADETYFKIPIDVEEAEITHKYIKLLDKNLKAIRDASNRYQMQLAQERVSQTPVEAPLLQPGNFSCKTCYLMTTDSTVLIAS